MSLGVDSFEGKCTGNKEAIVSFLCVEICWELKYMISASVEPAWSGPGHRPWARQPQQHDGDIGWDVPAVEFELHLVQREGARMEGIH